MAVPLLFDAALALACTFSPSGEPQIGPPLEPSAWYRLCGITPPEATQADLVALACAENLPEACLPRLRALPALLDAARGRLESLARRGVTVITACHADWPSRLTQRLGSSAPILLYTAGDLSLVHTGGLTVVGSRELTDEATTFAQRVGRTCADQAITVISGAAKGADRTAMTACLQEDGASIGVVPDGLGRAAHATVWRTHVDAGRLLLISMEPPEAAFTARAAHCRNRVLYALGDWSLVISAREGVGGTWTGAMTNLREGWSPLFVRDEPGAEAGNAALIRQGALPVARDVLGFGVGLRAWLNDMAESYNPQPCDSRPHEPVQSTLPFPPGPALLAVWPVLQPLLRQGVSASRVASELGVLNMQARRWLEEATAAGMAIRLARGRFGLPGEDNVIRTEG